MSRDRKKEVNLSLLVVVMRHVKYLERLCVKSSVENCCFGREASADHAASAERFIVLMLLHEICSKSTEITSSD